MLQLYVPLLITHMSLAVVSPVLFSMRAWRNIRGLDPAAGALRVLPHAVDTLLLAAGISLCFVIRQYPFHDAWLSAKLLALLLYIAVGHAAVRRLQARRARLAAWLLGLAIIAYIYGVALTKSPTWS